MRARLAKPVKFVYVSCIVATICIKVHSNPVENLARRQVNLIEDHSIPSFPHVPEQQEKEVHADRIGQGYSNTNVPWTLDKVTMHGDAKACLDFLRLMKIGEDVSFIPPTIIPACSKRSRIVPVSKTWNTRIIYPPLRNTHELGLKTNYFFPVNPSQFAWIGGE